MRLGEFSDVAATYLERDHGFSTRAAPHGLEEPPAIGDPLDVEHDGAGASIPGEVVENVGGGHVHSVAETHRKANPKALVMGMEGQGVVDSSALGDDRDPARFNLGRPGDEARAHPGLRVDEPRRVGSEHSDTRLPDYRESLLLQGCALRTALAHASGADDGCSHPGLGAVAQGWRHGGRRNGKHGEVHTFRDLGDRGVGGSSLYIGESWVNREQRAREGRQRPHHRIPRLVRRGRSAYDRDRAWLEQRRKGRLGLHEGVEPPASPAMASGATPVGARCTA